MGSGSFVGVLCALWLSGFGFVGLTYLVILVGLCWFANLL